MGGDMVFAVGTTVTNVNGTTVTNINPTNTNQSVTKIENPLKVNSVQQVIYLAVDIATYAGVAFAILALIYVGFKFVMAQGSEDKLKEAKSWFLYIIVGLAILISAKVIVEIVKNTLSDAGVVDKSVFNQNI